VNHLNKPDVFGKCVACDNDTATVCEHCKSKRPNEHYREVKFKLSNGSQMKVSFCDSCADEVKKKDFQWIMANVILGWETSLTKKPRTEDELQKYRKTYYNLKIEDFVK